MSVGKGLLTGGVALAKSSFSATFLSVKLQWALATYHCQALMDYRTEVNF